MSWKTKTTMLDGVSFILGVRRNDETGQLMYAGMIEAVDKGKVVNELPQDNEGS